MERIDTSHSIWLFDTERMRFRRLPRGADPIAPSLDRDWEPYFSLEVEADGAFTVALNAERTRLLRSYRDDADAADTTTEGTPQAQEPTAELRLETAEGHSEP